MRNSTTHEAPGLVSKSPARTLAAVLATALVAGGLSVAATAPASAVVTDTLIGYSLSWGFQTGAASWRIDTDGATPISPVAVPASTSQPVGYTKSSGFTLTGGTGTIDATTKVGEIDWDSSVTYYPQWGYGSLVAAQPWISFTDFELTTSSSTEGVLTAVVDWYKDSTHELATPARVEIATFDIASFTVSGTEFDFTSAAPDWTNAVPLNTYATGYADAWPAELNDLLLPKLSAQDINVYFHRTGTSAGNTAKAPLPLTLDTVRVKPTVTASVTSATPAGGVVIQASGDGFRSVTNAGDAGVYVGVAESGGLPDVSTSGAVAGFLAAAYASPAPPLTTGVFSKTLTVPTAKLDPAKSYSVYTWQAHTHSNTTQDTETPITLAPASIASDVALSAGPGTVVPGTAVKLTATVPALATRSVEFFDGATSLGSAAVASGSATLDVPAPSLGAHSYTAVYSGDAFHIASTSAAASVSVVKTSTAVTLALSSASIVSGEAIVATATVSPTTEGTIAFTSGATVLGSVPLTGGAASLSIAGLAVGSHSIVATFSGSATHESSASASAVVTVAAPAAPPAVVTPALLPAKAAVTAKAFTKGTKPKVSLSVAKLTNGKYATGKVRIYVGGKLVKTVTLKASHKGKLSVTLPKKYSKTIKVKIKYLGSSTVKAKTSMTIKVRVK